MTQFRFDFIINSQVLWGDCDTLDALGNLPADPPGKCQICDGHAILMEWTGQRTCWMMKRRVEQRGIELENIRKVMTTDEMSV